LSIQTLRPGYGPAPLAKRFFTVTIALLSDSSSVLGWSSIFPVLQCLSRSPRILDIQVFLLCSRLSAFKSGFIAICNFLS